MKKSGCSDFVVHIFFLNDKNLVIIFLCRGTAKVTVDPSHHAQQYPNIYTTDDPDSLEKLELIESLVP